MYDLIYFEQLANLCSRLSQLSLGEERGSKISKYGSRVCLVVSRCSMAVSKLRDILDGHPPYAYPYSPDDEMRTTRQESKYATSCMRWRMEKTKQKGSCRALQKPDQQP